MKHGLDIFDYVDFRNEVHAEFKSSIVAMYERNARWSKWYIRIVLRLLSAFMKPGKQSVRYFFWGVKYNEIIEGMNSKDVCVLGGPKQLLFCIRHGLRFIPVVNLWQRLAMGLSGDPLALKATDLQTVTSLFKLYGLPSAALVVDNDSLPMQRAVISSFKAAGLGHSVCIQHGILQSSTESFLLDGWIVDRYLVMDEIHKKMLVSKGLQEEKLRVMGFYNSPYAPVRPLSAPKERLICFFGQPWARYGGDRATRYLEIVDAVTRWAKSNGYRMVYKPHPWEAGLEHLESLQEKVECTMNAALEGYDVFVSITSTALVEATSAGRIAIQIEDKAFESDTFSTFSAVRSVKFNDSYFGAVFHSYVAGNAEMPGVADRPTERFRQALEA